MCSLLQLLQDICGSTYNTGVTGVDVEGRLERGSPAAGSVAERRNAGGEANGGVAVMEGRRCLPLGSVVRRRDNGKDAFVGVEEEGVPMGAATVATVLVGLSCVSVLKPADRGDTRFDGLAWKLSRNCCRESRVLLC